MNTPSPSPDLGRLARLARRVSVRSVAALACFGGLAAAAVACTSSSDAPTMMTDAGNVPVDGGAITPDSGGGGGGGDGDILPDGAVDPGDAGADAAPAIRDPFRHQWPVTAEQPSSSSYLVDADGGLVLDKVTGLVWTRALLDQSQTTADAGGAGLVGETDQARARAECASATVGGVTGFRLPTMVELMTIIDFDKNNWNDPKSFTDTAYGDVYWADVDTDGVPIVYDNHYPPWRFTSSPFAPQGPWASASIRCVKSPYAVSAHAGPPPAGRYLKSGPTAIDTVTKLEWQIAATPDVLTYGAASTHCAGLAQSDAGVDAGAEPWRIPTLKELASIWSEADGGLEPSVFGPVNGTGILWTSSLYWGNAVGQGPNIRFLWFPAGDTGPKYFSWEANQTISNVRCVRSVP